MPGPYAPNDTLIGPIVHQIALNIQRQIPSIGKVWEAVPDRAPSDNQVLLPVLKVKQLGDTNGKLKVLITVGARHVFRRQELDAGIARAYTYVMPWLQMLAAWNNATLGGLAIDVTTTDLVIARIIESGQVYPAVATNFNVLTEFNIDLT